MPQGRPISFVCVPSFVLTFATPVMSLAPFASSAISLLSGVTRDVTATAMPQASTPLDQSFMV